MPNLNLICLAKLILCYRYLLSNVGYYMQSVQSCLKYTIPSICMVWF